MRVLVAWLGLTDLRAARGEEPEGRLGPIAAAVAARPFDRALLLADGPKDARGYVEWLKRLTPLPVTIHTCTLTSPTDFEQIYAEAVKAISALRKRHGEDVELTFHTSPGTPAMAAVWIILGKTRFPAELLEASREAGVKTVSFPFEISAEYVPDLLRGAEQRMLRLSATTYPASPAFDDILHRSSAMRRAVEKARVVAATEVPVFIQGESGTGKEMLARALHAGSRRATKPFQAVNLGAIEPSLAASELFGHRKGAFTDAHADRPGYFEAADGGTLFLDEIGESPRDLQVKLLRALQEREITRVGETRPRKIDVRIVAATNRDLLRAVESGSFRDDLYYRIAVAVIHLPPLREREGDITLLVDHLLEAVARDAGTSERRKKLSPAARNLLLAHDWPGNVRELRNVLARAYLWSPPEVIGAEHVRDAIGGGRSGGLALLPELQDGFDVRKALQSIKRHYVEKALREANGNLSKASNLLGLEHYQTLSNWINTLNVER